MGIWKRFKTANIEISYVNEHGLVMHETVLDCGYFNMPKPGEDFLQAGDVFIQKDRVVRVKVVRVYEDWDDGKENTENKDTEG